MVVVLSPYPLAHALPSVLLEFCFDLFTFGAMEMQETVGFN